MLLSIAVLFLAGTVAATLALEHYVIDLVVAVPFACFAAEMAYRRVIAAAKYLGVVCVWLALIRFASHALVQYPWALRSVALLTLLLGVRAVAMQWLGPRKKIKAEVKPPLVSAMPDCSN